MLPSISSWIEKVALDLIGGRRYLVRGLPRAGKTWVAEALVAELGDSAVLVRGKEFTDENETIRRNRLSSTMHKLVERQGSAQLVFDDYHLALARSSGIALQRRLVHDLIDAEDSRDIGGIFFSRLTPKVHLAAPGSPLVSRLEPLRLPIWDEEDLTALDLNDNTDVLRSRIGYGMASLVRFSQFGYSSVVERLIADGESITRDLPQSLRSALGQGEEPRQTDDCILASDLLTAEDGKFCWIEAVKDANLAGHISRTPTWPATLTESAHEFAKITAGWETLLWCDRYIAKYPDECVDFLKMFRHTSGRKIRILTSDWIDEQRITHNSLNRIEKIKGVEIRLMTPSQRNVMHDRHLVRCGENTGWAIPVCGVLFGLQLPGSAVATLAPDGFGLDYDQEWTRSIRPRF